MELSSPKLKNSLYFRRNFKNKSKKQKISHFLPVERELFKHKG